MTPEQFRAARDALDLTPSQLAAEWGMVDEWGKTDNGERSIRRWESGDRAVSKVTAYCIRLMVAVKNSA